MAPEMTRSHPHFQGTEKLKEEVKTTSHATFNINYHFIWILKQQIRDSLDKETHKALDKTLEDFL